ncbi:MAG: hypothetical protein GY739_11700, partial [Mesoflavibacter sp.]|nr:hypothetical protein [Mesoflavibacter sp.]
FQRTMQRQRELEHQGYTVEAVWECEVQKRLRTDSKMAAAIEEIDVVMPIDPREAFFGGRVNATKLFHSCSEGERIRYLDICSLYPFVNKYCRYPIGHPSVITRDFKSIDNYFGLAKVRVLPPTQLFHPVLPRRSQGKLCFPLCAMCADTQSATCTHTDEQRSWIGTYTTMELQESLRCGYQVLHWFEVWHYDQSAIYDGTDPETGLFTQYINTFLKLK